MQKVYIAPMEFECHARSYEFGLVWDLLALCDKPSLSFLKLAPA